MHDYRIIADWRKIKIDPYVKRDGLNWWWCGKNEGPDYNGLYVRYKPKFHRGAPMINQGRRTERPHPPPATQDRTDRKLQLSQSMKASLLTMVTFAEEQADAIVEKRESALPQDF